MMDLLSGQRGRPGQALVGFSEGRGGAEAGEDLSRRVEGLSGLGRAAECEQAAAVSQQRSHGISNFFQRRSAPAYSAAASQCSSRYSASWARAVTSACWSRGCTGVSPAANRAARPGSPAAMVTRRMPGRLGMYSGVCRTLRTCSSSVSSVTAPRASPAPAPATAASTKSVVSHCGSPNSRAFSPPARPTQPVRPGRARRAGHTIERQRRAGRAGTSGPRLYPRR